MRSMSETIKSSRERFIQDTDLHRMTVLRDDELYRHLRFGKEGTVIYRFDLVTWPGYLAFVGDAGDYLFARSRDMFEFFAPDRPNGLRGGFEDAAWGINPQYWSEKLQAPAPRDATSYSRDTFHERVIEWAINTGADWYTEDKTALRAAIQSQILDQDAYDDHEAHALLNEFEHRGLRIVDGWEWDFREYSMQFLWCCWAIVWGISQYRAKVEVPS